MRYCKWDNNILSNPAEFLRHLLEEILIASP